MNSLVRPGDGHELLPPPSCDVSDIEAEDERQRDEVDKGIAIYHHLLEESEKLRCYQPSSVIIINLIIYKSQ